MIAQVLHIDTEAPLDLAEVVRAAAAKDAQLQACLLYLAAHPGELPLAQLAAAYNITDWTGVRWIRTLAELKLLTFQRISDGVVKITILAQNGARRDPAPTAPKKAPNPAPTQSSAAVEPQKAPEPTAKPAESLIHGARLRAALDVYDVCEQLAARGNRAEVAKTLRAIVNSSMFDRLDLPKELLDADAWLVQSRRPYRDMGRYLTNWLRMAVKRKPAPKNANAPKPEKYASLAATARSGK